MSTTTLIIVIIVLVLLFGGGGFYWRADAESFLGRSGFSPIAQRDRWIRLDPTRAVRGDGRTTS